MNGQRQGQGRFVFYDGSVFEGEWVAGLYHGHGTSVHPDGKTFVGQFREGEAHGHGKETDATGMVIYEGEWIKGVRADQVVEVNDAEEQVVAVVEDYDNDVDNGGQSVYASRPNANSPLKQQQQQQTTSARRTAPTMSKARDIVADTRERGEDCEAVVEQSIQDAHGNPGKYTGIVAKKSRKPHGTGRIVYADGQRIHEGFWIQGSKEGFGRCLFFPQGDFHEGEYFNNLRHGPGRYQWKDGRYFQGSYKDDLRHGKGTFTYPSGEKYVGMFAKGQRQGFGRFDFDDGKGYYIGEWAAGTYNGEGRIVLSNGSTYEGEFEKGVVHGHGVRKSPTGEIIEQGRWIEGKFQQPKVKPANEPPSSESSPPEKNDISRLEQDVSSHASTTGDDGAETPGSSAHGSATLVEQ